MDGCVAYSFDNGGKVGWEGAERGIEAEDDDCRKIVLVIVAGGQHLMKIDPFLNVTTSASACPGADDGILSLVEEGDFVGAVGKEEIGCDCTDKAGQSLCRISQYSVCTFVGRCYVYR